MAAHRGLGELQNLDELGDPELGGLQQPEEAYAGGVSQALHSRQQSLGRPDFHHYIRMEGYIGPGRRVNESVR